MTNPRRALVRFLVRAAVVTSVIALAASLFVHPTVARAFDQDIYAQCVALNQGENYCCTQAGGVVKSWGCTDPAAQAGPTTISTQTVRPAPPLIPPRTVP